MTRSERRQEVLTYLGRMTEEGFNRLQADERERLIRAVREAADTEPPTAHASDPYPVT